MTSTGLYAPFLTMHASWTPSMITLLSLIPPIATDHCWSGLPFGISHTIRRTCRSRRNHHPQTTSNTGQEIFPAAETLNMWLTEHHGLYGMHGLLSIASCQTFGT